MTEADESAEPLTTSDLRAIAVEADTHPDTVRRAMKGQPTWRKTYRRIAAAAVKLGFRAPPPWRSSWVHIDR